MKKKEDTAYCAPKTLIQWLFRVLQGAIIGAGAILPGISGGVLCVVFGIYQPMMALLAHPFRTFKKYVLLLFPVLIGWVLGFLLIAQVLSLLFSSETFAIPATWLFFGLIIGTFPQLYREAGKQGRTYKSWIALAVSTAMILALLVFMQYGTRIEIAAGIWDISSVWWYLFCGALWGVSLVMPGLSSSSLLLFLGLYIHDCRHFHVRAHRHHSYGHWNSFGSVFIRPCDQLYVRPALLFRISRSAGLCDCFNHCYYSSSLGNTGAGGESIGIVYTGDSLRF